MKNQYFGDIGDYGKYGLLRFLAQNGVKIAVNWYLTTNDGSGDGKHVSYLEKQGLIVRERSEADRRKVCLHLSDSGRDLAMRLREQYYTFFQTCLTDFSEAEQKELFRLLEKFVSNCPPFSKEI